MEEAWAHLLSSWRRTDLPLPLRSVLHERLTTRFVNLRNRIRLCKTYANEVCVEEKMGGKGSERYERPIKNWDIIIIKLVFPWWTSWTANIQQWQFQCLDATMNKKKQQYRNSYVNLMKIRAWAWTCGGHSSQIYTHSLVWMTRARARSNQ